MILNEQSLPLDSVFHFNVNGKAWLFDLDYGHVRLRSRLELLKGGLLFFFANNGGGKAVVMFTSSRQHLQARFFPDTRHKHLLAGSLGKRMIKEKVDIGPKKEKRKTKFDHFLTLHPEYIILPLCPSTRSLSGDKYLQWKFCRGKPFLHSDGLWKLILPFNIFFCFSKPKRWGEGRKFSV